LIINIDMGDEFLRIQMRMDALGEVGIIGAGNASSAFSELLDCEIQLKTPWVKLVPINDVPGMIGAPKDLLVEVYAKVAGDMDALIITAFDRAGAKKLTDTVISSVIVRKEVPVIDPLGRDALKEICNILFGSYLTAFNKFLDLDVCHQVPMIYFTLTERSVSGIISQFGLNVTHALIVAADFTAKDTIIRGKMMMLLNSTSMALLVDKLEKKLKK
jgi:chemotaxis protein CheC